MTIKSVAIIGAGAAGIYEFDLRRGFLSTSNMMSQELIEKLQAPQQQQLSPPSNTSRQSESLSGRGVQEGHGSLALTKKSKTSDLTFENIGYTTPIQAP
jgi:hypothetical protein